VEQISKEEFNVWKNLRVTQQFFLELAEMYYDNVTREPVVIAHAQIATQNKAGDPVLFAHTNPVEETAINSALKAGRVQVMEVLMEYKPSNLEEEKANDD
jgi:hypothetical protein